MRRPGTLTLPFGGPRDPWEVLDWAAWQTGRYVAVEPDAGGDPVAVRRRLLVQARHALRPFRDLTCAVSDAIRFGWHGGRGYLTLTTRCQCEPSHPTPSGRVLFDAGHDEGIVEAPLLRRRVAAGRAA